MIGLLATIRVQDGKGAEFEAVFVELAAKVRANEAGNSLYQLVRSRKEANTYVVMELYKDQDAVAAHSGTDYFKALGRQMGAFMAGPPAVEHFDAVE